MEVAIIQLGQPWQTLASTSLIKGIRRVFGDCNLHWMTTAESLPLIQYNRNICRVSTDINDFNGPYDFIVNLTPDLEVCKAFSRVRTNARFGYIYREDDRSVVNFANDNAKDWHGVVCNNLTSISSCNVLQSLFRVVGMTWKGEGYDLAYYPKNKVKKGKVGIAICDSELRTYVKKNLDLKLSDIWHVPMRRNLLKRIDEINVCKMLVTDDLFSLHAGIALRKNVQFLDRENLNLTFEFFGRGQHHRIGKHG